MTFMEWMQGFTWWEAALWFGIVVLVLLPPKYDPLIRLKEWNIKVQDRNGGGPIG